MQMYLLHIGNNYNDYFNMFNNLLASSMNAIFLSENDKCFKLLRGVLVGMVDPYNRENSTSEAMSSHSPEGGQDHNALFPLKCW